MGRPRKNIDGEEEGDLAMHLNETMREICIPAHRHRRRALALPLIVPEGKKHGRRIFLPLSVLRTRGGEWGRGPSIPASSPPLLYYKLPMCLKSHVIRIPDTISNKRHNDSLKMAFRLKCTLKKKKKKHVKKYTHKVEALNQHEYVCVCTGIVRP